MYDRKDEAREKFLNMYEYTQQKEAEVSKLEARIEQLKQDYEPYKAQDELNAINKYFPMMNEQMRIVGYVSKSGWFSTPFVRYYSVRPSRVIR